MIEIIQNGDIFNSKCEVITNPVNCYGVMGKGLALEFKKRFPDMFRHYQFLCYEGRLTLGNPWVYDFPRRILLFPTKQHWKYPSKIENIEKGLQHLIIKYPDIASIAFPALGCGLGGLQWKDVKQVIIDQFENTDIFVELYEPEKP